MPWEYPNTFSVPKPEVVAPWGTIPAAPAPWVAKPSPAPVERPPPFADDEAQKKLYGIEWAKTPDAFGAACKLFTNTTHALWASRHWIIDPVVIASRDIYLKTIETDRPVLDKNALLAKVLAFSEAVSDSGKPLVEAEERLNALKLYAEIQGYIGNKIDIDNSTHNNLTNNEITIKLVKPEDVKPKIINNVPNTKSENLND